MANLKQIKTRIGSLDSITKLISAIKMVASVKYQKQHHIMISVQKIANMMAKAMDIANAEDFDNIYVKGNDNKNDDTLIIAICADKGLCGGFNSNIIKALKKESYLSVLAIGHKLRSQLKDAFAFFDLSKCGDDNEEDIVKVIAQKAIEDYKSGKISKVKILYNKFKSTAIHDPILQTLLPYDFCQKSNEDDNVYTIEVENMIESITEKYVYHSIKMAIQNTLCGEYAARMIAMNNAYDNCLDLNSELKLKYNNIRQSGITKELIEIVSGAEAI